MAKKPMFEKVAFTMFTVEDPMRARAFYEKTLGLERGLASKDGAWTEYDLPGGGCLALFKHPDPNVAHKAGGGAIAFEVADLDALDKKLAKQGIAIKGGRIKGPHCQMSNIVDTEGNAIILHQLNVKKGATSSARPAGTKSRSRTQPARGRARAGQRTAR